MNHRWQKKACDIVNDVIRNRPLEAHFVHKGLFQDSAYILLTCKDYDSTTIHVSWLLIAFDLALIETKGLQHPLWPVDTPC